MRQDRFRLTAALQALALVLLAGLSLPARRRIRAAERRGPADVSGHVGKTNGSGIISFDLDLLASLPQTEFTTSTTWTDGTPTFKGVLLKDLIDAVGATGTTINLTALNDYKISMPMADVRDDGPLLAILMNGKTMSVRDKGPVWLVYPYDANADYRTEQTYARSIWQLDRIEFAG